MTSSDRKVPPPESWHAARIPESNLLNPDTLNRIQCGAMKIVSLNIGLPRDVQWHDHSVSTGIFKSPTPKRIRLRKLNLDGDGQADLTAVNREEIGRAHV